MKAIPIYDASSDDIVRQSETKLSEALAGVQYEMLGLAPISLMDLVRIVRKVEFLLESRGLDQALRGGTEIDFIPAGPVSNYAGNEAKSIRMRFRRSRRGVWQLISAKRVAVRPGASDFRTIRTSAEALEMIRQEALAPFDPEPLL